jgi:monoterpene epsilon-lactone hydrolase
MQSHSTEAWSQIHALTSQDRVVMDQMRAVVEPNKGKLRGVGARAPYEAIMGRVAAPDGVTFRPDKIGGIAGW